MLFMIIIDCRYSVWTFHMCFFFNDTPTTEIYTLSLHDALPIYPSYRETHVYGNILIEPNGAGNRQIVHYGGDSGSRANYRNGTDRKSTRLNSSHANISYAVFCLKKKKTHNYIVISFKKRLLLMG